MKESEKTEFKKSLAELGDGLNSIAAMLNPFIINASATAIAATPTKSASPSFPTASKSAIQAH